MKIFKSILLLLVFAVVTLIAEKYGKQLEGQSIKQSVNTVVTHAINSRTKYKFDIKYLAKDNSFLVEEIIEWNNTDSSNIHTLFFNIPKGDIEANDISSKLDYTIDLFKINGNEIELEYIAVDEKNFIDSTLAKVNIPGGIKDGATALVSISYKIKLPSNRFFTDAHFYNFENWYVTISPYLDGKFVCYPFHKFIEPFLEFADYKVNLKLPKAFDVALSGKTKESTDDNFKIINCDIKNITRFNWFAFDELSKFSKIISIKNRAIETTLFIDDSKDGYVERYFDMSEKYLKSLSEFSSYPSENLTIVDLPNMSSEKSKSYPNLIALNSDLISPLKTQKLEYKMAFLISELYFGNILASNNMEESWLSKGISAYLAEKIVRKHYGDLYSFFTIADYYPIYGLHFMTYAGIPIIYTVANQVIPEGARFLSDYYNNLAFSNLSTSTFLQPNYGAYKTSSIVKPQITLLALENMIGKEMFNKRLKNYFHKNIYSYPNANDFISSMTKESSKENSNYCKELFQTDNAFDYAIKYIEKRSSNVYDIMVIRIEDGVIPIKLVVNTSSDTIAYKWDGKDKFKIFTIYSEAEIISAEIDSENRNILDLNFANNSYIVKEQYWGSVSYATRVFFWFQNALMLIGGKG